MTTETKRNMQTLIVGGAVLVVMMFGLLMYRNYQLMESMSIRLAQYEVDHKLATQLDTSAQIVEKIVSKSEVWRPVQEQVRDTVVQVFSQIAELDLLQPYKTPAQYAATGSGFFINSEGELATNAHVVSQATAVWIQIPSLGKRILDVEIIGVTPERDLALLRLTPESLQVVKEQLGAVPYLMLGDSDQVRRADEVMALGYPLGQQSLKSTTGVISGRERHMIQMSAAINPGNSGGPLLNVNGEVVGINSAGITQAQNVGYIIPINDLKIVLDDLHKIPLLRKPFLGVLYNNGTDTLTDYLGNPQPGGCYVVEVLKNSTLYKAGVQRGDMIYEINGHRLDVYGEMNVPWSEDKISIIDYITRLSLGQEVSLVIYRNGACKEIKVEFSQAELPSIRRIFPGFEEVDYEVVAGMVIMPLTMNHIQILGNNATGLSRYAEVHNQNEPALVVTHIFPNSQIYRSRTFALGATINEVNGIKVNTLKDLRNALKSGIGSKYITFKAADNVTRTSENVFVALPYDRVIEQEEKLARDYHYQISDTVKELIEAHAMQQKASEVAA